MLYYGLILQQVIGILITYTQEVLHNDDKIKGIPLISKSNDFEELMYKNGKENQLYYITDELDVPDHLQQADAHLLVSYDKEN